MSRHQPRYSINEKRPRHYAAELLNAPPGPRGALVGHVPDQYLDTVLFYCQDWPARTAERKAWRIRQLRAAAPRSTHRTEDNWPPEPPDWL